MRVSGVLMAKKCLLVGGKTEFAGTYRHLADKLTAEFGLEVRWVHQARAADVRGADLVLVTMDVISWKTAAAAFQLAEIADVLALPVSRKWSHIHSQITASGSR